MNSLNGKWRLLSLLLAFLMISLSSCLKEQEEALAEAICNGIIQGIVIDEYGQPVPGVWLQLQGSDRAAQTDREGFFRMEHVPVGEARLDLIQEVETVGNESAEPEKEQIRIEAAVVVTVEPNGTVTIEIKVKIKIKIVPDCNCKPWCGIVGVTDTRTGAQRVVAGGGTRPKNCPHPVTIKITDPAGNNHNPPQPPGRQTFDPAAGGKWSVSVTVCGKTKTCSINL